MGIRYEIVVTPPGRWHCKQNLGDFLIYIRGYYMLLKILKSKNNTLTYQNPFYLGNKVMVVSLPMERHNILTLYEHIYKCFFFRISDAVGASLEKLPSNVYFHISPQ